MEAAARIAGDVRVRMYGSSELGILALTAPGDAHPRVEYVGGEVFIGLARDGGDVAVTQGDTQGDDDAFRDAVRAAVPREGALPESVGGVIVLTDEALALSVLVGGISVPADALHGTPVVFPFARDLVAVVGSDDEAALGRALDLAEERSEGGDPVVSVQPIALTPAGPAPFDVRERFPALALRFERMLRLFAVRAYDAQTEVLQRPDMHVAPAKIQVLDTGVTTTFAAWPKGTATLLPVVDNVIVADPSGQLSVATLPQFLDAAGDAVVRTGLSPARYFIPGEAPRR